MTNNIEHPDAEMKDFIRKIGDRQAQKLLELAQEQKLLPPFVMEDFDANGERYCYQVWDLDHNGQLYLVEDKSPDRTAPGIPWPVVMRCTDKNGKSVEVSGDDVRRTDDIGLQVFFADKRPFSTIKALAVKVFGEEVASSLQPNQVMDVSNFLKPNTPTYEITLPGSWENNANRISSFLESRHFLTFFQRWDGNPGPRVVLIYPHGINAVRD